MKISNWMQAISYCQEKQHPFVLATVIEHKGSVPRDSGAKMVITQDQTFDTIGGGNLEYMVTRSAQTMLLANNTAIKVEEYPLSAKLAQCCGGFAKVLLESHQIQTQQIAVFGSGHVANELLPILQRLPVRIHWIDERSDLFPATMQANVNIIATDCPVSELKLLPANTLVLIMTHNHQLDFDLVKTALKRDDIQYVGMIGSQTKAKRFRYKLKQRELSDVQINKLVSPVGELSVPGKTPIEVAISMAAQITQLLHQSKQQSTDTDTEEYIQEDTHA
ncbi:xanthine dehydrogenase accessory protein XdhC [Planctobacterium marinum]|uniref:xanthine dehydrogenase accessory protein XdhC n=1 Tax=Planctobacterium marinum TaxID=1631968 RepID=UPI001E43980D|nr:xanthine dehydrogenase accessory protein XdhC [Planctobacterium marinum]MCC2604343.1 xanthine dehydrogenase accessory protein XdhC [Planctobacterium marinum]